MCVWGGGGQTNSLDSASKTPLFTYFQADATNLENLASNSIESISALCSLEHFGLGRYGDPIDPDAWEKAMKAFERVVKPGGKIYISVPVGKQNMVCFNAHRVFLPETIIETFSACQLLEFSWIDSFETQICMAFEDGSLKVDSNKLNAIPEYINSGNIGLFEFVKK